MDESIGHTFVSAASTGWEPGHFDAELALDGKAFRPDGKTSAVLVPPAFGLADVNLHTWTGGGSVPYSSAFVPNLELHGKGNFFDSRLRNGTQFPIAAHGFDNVRNEPAPDHFQVGLAAVLSAGHSRPRATGGLLAPRNTLPVMSRRSRGSRNDPHPAQDLPRKRSAVQAKAPRSNGLTKRHGRVGSF